MSNCENKVSEEFPELFHYTTVSAFENIYKTRQLWSTHYKDLNDVTEFARFKLKLFKYITPKSREILNKYMQCDAGIAAEVEKQGGIDTVVHNDAESLLSLLHDTMFKKDMYKETFVCCFCAHKSTTDEARDGLLSQWRGYAADGVAIVFDTSCVETMLDCECKRFQLHRALWTEVIYDNSSNDELIQRRLCGVFKYIDKNLSEMLKGIFPEEDLDKMYYGFLSGSVRIKHNAFHEENEIRIDEIAAELGIDKEIVKHFLASIGGGSNGITISNPKLSRRQD
jgi:hypothetical protein